MSSRKRRRDDTYAAPSGEGLKAALETARAAVGDMDGFIQILTRVAGHTMALGCGGVKKSLEEVCGESPLSDEQIDGIVHQAKRARKGKMGDTAPLAEVIWLVKHHGVQKTAETRLAARSGLQKRSAGSDAFEKYYKAQKIVPEGEWDAFIESLRTPLPMTLRLSRTRPYGYVIQREVKELIKSTEGVLTQLPWANQDPSDPERVSAVACPHRAFHDAENQEMPGWCKQQNVLGTASFQEAASLLPPLLLDPSHSDLVLDMCSAPGSKLLQCVDIMSAKSAKEGVMVTGGILSNELDKKKAMQIIPARIKRAHAGNVVVTASDARLFPAMYERPTEDTPTRRLYFDRIMADVPCSGDGTGRKDTNIWETWSTHYCLSLHVKQLQILLKGLDSLKPGGRLVYSTCSLNPLEDEAVVMAALRTMREEVKLVPTLLPGFKFQPGVTSWGVPDAMGELHTTSGSLSQEEMSDRGWAASMFPIEDELAMEAGKCGRVLPHHNDTSGFFMAVFERTCVKHEPEPPAPPRKARVDKDGKKAPGQTGLGGMRNARMYYNLASKLDAAWQQVAEWFGMKEEPKEELGERMLLVQLSEHDKSCKKAMFVTSPGAEKILHSLIPVSQTNNVVVTAVGTRFLTQIKGSYLKDVPCKYRAAFEGASQLSKMATRRKFTLVPALILPLLRDKYLPLTPDVIASVGEMFKGPCIVGIQTDVDPAWGEVWLSCVLHPTKIELTVEDHEREGLFALMTRVFSAGEAKG